MTHFFFALLFLLPFTSSAADRPSSSNHILVYSIVGAESVPVVKGNAKQKGEQIVGPGDDVSVGDEIHTNANTVVVLRQWDYSTYILGPNSQMKLDAHVGNNGAWTLNLLKGAVHGDVEADPKKTTVKLRIKTRVAVMGVRGTEFLVSFGADSTMRLYTKKGEVVFGRSENFEPGSFISVKEKMFAEIGPDEAKKMEPPKEDPASFGEAMKLNKIPDGEATKTLIKKAQNKQDCLARGKGWRVVPGEDPLGECY